MKALYGLVFGGLVVIALAACDARPCDLDRMAKVIHTDLRDNSRSPDEFVMETPKPDGPLGYVGMAQKLNLLYRHHYCIDPKQCRIAKILVDQ